MNPALYVVGTPIGNLGDLSFRAVETLRGVQAILAEDTRCTRVLLDRYEIRTQLISCHKFNEASRLDEILGRIRSGQAMALVTDSGMPGISDPGARVVAACRAAGLKIEAVPGPTALTTALSLSGCRGSKFFFGGFLPRTSGARLRELQALAAMNVPAVVYESPYRIVKLLQAAQEPFGERRILVARELTKKFEEVLVGTAAELLKRLETRKLKGEIVVVLGVTDGMGPGPVVEGEDEEEEGLRGEDGDEGETRGEGEGGDEGSC
jgi:16S rRNA (cytidine1402-2'-O)-methyltransferase